MVVYPQVSVFRQTCSARPNDERASVLLEKIREEKEHPQPQWKKDKTEVKYLPRQSNCGFHLAEDFLKLK